MRKHKYPATGVLLDQVHAHDYIGADGQIDQELAGAKIDALRSLHKAKKTRITLIKTAHFVEDGKEPGYEATLRVVPISD